MDKSRAELIAFLQRNEEEVIVKGLAFMTYNPSIGRVLEKGGVDKFATLIVNNIDSLKKINSQEKFDEFHDFIAKKIIEDFKTAKGNDLSYGQAQKPLNVFLKVYIDWASLPTLERANRLRRYIHVPLDSILMEEIEKQFPREYEQYVVATYDSERDQLRKVLEKKGEEVNASTLRQFINPRDFSLRNIHFREMYYAWQHCARAIYSEKPILLDVIWSIKRREL